MHASPELLLTAAAARAYRARREAWLSEAMESLQGAAGQALAQRDALDMQAFCWEVHDLLAECPSVEGFYLEDGLKGFGSGVARILRSLRVTGFPLSQAVRAPNAPSVGARLNAAAARFGSACPDRIWDVVNRAYGRKDFVTWSGELCGPRWRAVMEERRLEATLPQASASSPRGPRL